MTHWSDKPTTIERAQAATHTTDWTLNLTPAEIRAKRAVWAAEDLAVDAWLADPERRHTEHSRTTWPVRERDRGRVLGDRRFGNS